MFVVGRRKDLDKSRALVVIYNILMIAPPHLIRRIYATFLAIGLRISHVVELLLLFFLYHVVFCY